MKSIKGILHVYSATGEPPRLQFIGNNSLKDGFVYSYDQVYDIEIGDDIKLIHKDFKDNKLEISDYLYNFLTSLCHIFKKDEIEVEYNPNVAKSWEQNSNKHKENQMGQHKPSNTKKSGNGSKRK